MSIRLALIGINLEKLENIFGCNDPKVAQDLKKKYDEFDNDSKEEMLKVHRLINNIVMGEITPQEAEEDNFFPLLLENVLVSYDQEVIWAKGDRCDTFTEYLDLAAWKLKGEAKKLATHFLAGRALFTEYGKLPYEEFPYTYLRHEEIKKLLDYMEEHKEVFYDYDGWGREFPRFLKEVYEKGLDLFSFAS